MDFEKKYQCLTLTPQEAVESIKNIDSIINLNPFESFLIEDLSEYSNKEQIEIRECRKKNCKKFL